MQRILAGALLFAVMSCTVHAQTQPYVIDIQGNRIVGDALAANAQGDLQLRIGGATRQFKRGTYREAWMPKPQKVELLERALEQQRYEVVANNAQAVFQEVQYLGWGGNVAYMHAQVLMQQDKPREALTVLQRGEAVAGQAKEEITMGLTQAYLALGNDKEARELLTKLKASDAKETVAFAFIASGQLLERENKKKEAVLEYLKTVLLFEPGTVPRERQEAKARAVALLKGIGDERWQLIESME